MMSERIEKINGTSEKEPTVLLKAVAPKNSVASEKKKVKRKVPNKETERHLTVQDALDQIQILRHAAAVAEFLGHYAIRAFAGIDGTPPSHLIATASGTEMARQEAITIIQELLFTESRDLKIKARQLLALALEHLSDERVIKLLADNFNGADELSGEDRWSSDHRAVDKRLAESAILQRDIR